MAGHIGHQGKNLRSRFHRPAEALVREQTKSTVGRPPSFHTIIPLIPPHPLDPVLPSDDIPRVQQAGQPPEQGKKYVEAEVRTASPCDQDRGRREEDGENEEDDA